ncbi:MAG: DUF4040 family protein [Arachnia sp.]
MAIVWTLGILGLAVALTPFMCRALGRLAGWPLAAAYLAAAAALAPAGAAVVRGQTPTWEAPLLPALGIRLSFAADGLGIVFAAIALVIGAVVFAYSTRYLGSGPQYSFYLVMTVFTLSMVGLVLASDLVVLFIAWELTSLASFLLIARSGSAGEAASMRTLLMTFIGGVFLLAAVATIWARFGTTDLTEIFTSPVWVSDPGFTSIVAVLIGIAAMTKSAQFPFHVWLPDAMAAITPVSAYLHAAAVVKAGIFLLLRFSPLFADTPVWNWLLIGAGLFTSVLGAWFAMQQTDIKRLMAYSTVSQLGLIVATIGIGTEAALVAGVVHVIAHAMFKSGLFMMVGVIDHAAHTRDLRRMPAQLWKKMPVSFMVAIIGCASMAGIPPMLGFLSKELLLESMLHAPGASWTGWATFIVMAAGAVLTFSYSMKFVLGVFVDGPEVERPSDPADPILTSTAALPILASVPLAFAPFLLDPIVGWAGAAASGEAFHEPHLALWHGITPPLIATGIVLAIGAVITWQRRRVFHVVEGRVFPITGVDVIAAIGNVLGRVGTALDRLVAADDAPRHILPIVASLAAVGLGGVVAVNRAGLPPQTPGMTQPEDIGLLVLITVAVVAVINSRSRLGAAVSLSAVGILMTVQILALGGPDVAMTQLLVESLSIIIIMLVLQRMPLTIYRSGRLTQTASLVVAVAAGAAMAGLVWALNGRRERSWLGDYYLETTESIAGGYNVVNIILVEFRALDTMGELSVLGMAGVAIIAVLSTLRDRYIDPADAEERIAPRPKLSLNPDRASSAHRAIHVAWPNVVALQLMLRFAVPVLLFTSLLLFFRGHNEPGGGFNAALVTSAIVGMVYLSTSRDRQIGPPRAPLFLIGGGILIAVLTGFLGLAVKGSFLEPIHGYVLGIHLSSSMIFDAGVFSAVVGLIMVAVNILGTSDGSAHTGESTRERVDESLVGELPGPLDTVRGESDRPVRIGSRFLAEGRPPKEVGR